MIRLIYALTIFLCMAANVYGKKADYLILKSFPQGMFVNTEIVLWCLYHYDQGHCEGVETRFGETGLYYDAAHGDNWWNYYWKPIKLGRIKPYTRFIELEGWDNRKFHWKDPLFIHQKTLLLTEVYGRAKVNKVLKKYIILQDSLREEIETFVKAHFEGFYLIGVHYRGTDKMKEASRVDYEKIRCCVDHAIEDAFQTDWKLFVASDEAAFIAFMIEQYGAEKVCYQQSLLRSTDKKPIHFNTSDPYLHGKEAVMDSYLLSKVDLLIKTKSNLNRFSSYINPKLRIISVN